MVVAKLVKSFSPQQTQSIAPAHYIGIDLRQKKKVPQSTMAVNTLSLSHECDIAVYINKLISKLFYTDGSKLDIVAYTNNQSLYDVVNSMKQTLEKWLMFDISPIQEIIERTKIKVTWIGKEKQTKTTAMDDQHLNVEDTE